MRTRVAAVVVGIALVVVAGGLVVRSGRVDVSVEYGGVVDGRITVVAGETEVVRVNVDPPRRADGLTMTLDGIPVAHPKGERPGQIVWDPSGLGPGTYELRIEVPRPAWFPAVTEFDVVVVGSPAAN